MPCRISTGLHEWLNEVPTVPSQDLVKLLFWDGQGLCLYAKRLDRGRFVWPNAQDGVVSLTPAQLSMLLEGIDWRMPAWTMGSSSESCSRTWPKLFAPCKPRCSHCGRVLPEMSMPSGMPIQAGASGLAASTGSSMVMVS